MTELDYTIETILTSNMTHDSQKSIIDVLGSQFPNPHKLSVDFDGSILQSTVEVANSPENKEFNSKDPSVGLNFLPSKAEEFYRKNGGSFTLMVAGESGLGKTTFINTLFNSNLITKVKSTASISVQKFSLQEQGFPLKLTTIDTPGFGERINNRKSWEPLNEFIDEQFRLYLFQSEQPNRNKLVDTRVHCCLYFLSPSGTTLAPLDLLTMQELSKRVNLIPVIAKSDTFNNAELEVFKNLVKAALKTYDIGICNLILDDDVILNIHSMVPFAVIGSNEYHDSQIKPVRGRKYKWGLAEVENPQHCDFIKLRDLLMGNHLLDFVISTETHYENYRRQCLQEKLNESLHLNDMTLVNEPTGIAEYLVYNKYSLDEFEKNLITRYDQEYDEKENAIRSNMNEVISVQEKRFKEWKKALVDKQNSFNKDIEHHHKLVLELQKLVNTLEAKSTLLSVYSEEIKDKSFVPINTENLSDSE